MAQNLGQVAAILFGTVAPANTNVIWGYTTTNDPNTWQILEYRHYVNGAWPSIGNIQVINNLNSFLTTGAALSPNMGRILNQATANNENEILDIKLDLVTNYQNKSEKNQANGYAGLDSAGKIPGFLLNFSGLLPQGTWDASSGSVPSATPEEGWFWIVTTAGNTPVGGLSNWDIGDWVLYADGQWHEIPAIVISQYNGLDQTLPGFSLDARQGPIIDDRLTTAQQGVNDNAGDIDDLDTRATALEDAVSDLEANYPLKQDKLIRLKGTVGNNQYTHPSLANIDINNLDVFVGNELLMDGAVSKPLAGTTISLPPVYNGNEIRVIHIPS